ncbi:hypothetical protein GCM10010372_51280 [Streptomyces tauricus]|nr:hypothetical protein GCM10010372_51280 [Streptomyces tauricus]
MIRRTTATGSLRLQRQHFGHAMHRRKLLHGRISSRQDYEARGSRFLHSNADYERYWQNLGVTAEISYACGPSTMGLRPADMLPEAPQRPVRNPCTIR